MFAGQLTRLRVDLKRLLAHGAVRLGLHMRFTDLDRRHGLDRRLGRRRVLRAAEAVHLDLRELL